MKSLLAEFLKGNSEIVYPPIDVKVVSSSPLKVTDDLEVHFEVASKLFITVELNPALIKAVAD